MTRYFIELAYNGTNYHGWQIQPNAISVQEVLNFHISMVLGEKVELTGAGRTDTGVHASYYMAHFDCSSANLADDERLLARLNGFLPADIAIHRIYEVIPEAHARFDALSRTYEYRLGRKKNPFLQDLCYFYPGPLRIDLMQQACEILLVTDDFSSFCKKGSDENTTICRISEAQWIEKDDMFVFRIRADRFLRNMVRAIVGTHLLIGREKMNLEEFRQVLNNRNRMDAGDSVPGKGLYICSLVYQDHLFPKARPMVPGL